MFIFLKAYGLYCLYIEHQNKTISVRAYAVFYSLLLKKAGVFASNRNIYYEMIGKRIIVTSSK